MVKRRGRKAYPLDVLWVLPRKREVKEKWDFEEQVNQVVKAWWDDELKRALDYALQTAK